MTLIKTSDKLSSDSFYSPICAAGYLTPLQRKKMREKRNIGFSLSAPEESCISKNTGKTSKGVQKAKSKRTAKTKPMEKLAKKVLNHRHSVPSLQCSVAELVKPNNDVSKEKKFFKNRSPQHLKKAKFVLPLAYKKGLDFTPATSAQHANVGDQHSTHNSNMETSSDSIKLDMSLETCVADDNVSFNSKMNQSSSSETSTSQNSDKEISTCHKNKEMCDKFDLFDFNWPSDEVLIERENKARAKHRESLEAMKRNSSFEDFNESSIDVEELSQSTKLFPIFDRIKRMLNKELLSINEESCSPPKTKPKPLNFLDNSKGSEQLIIDAGQKEIGATLCKTCGMIYTIGQEEDEKLHASYHQTYLINLKFPGWKKEFVIGNYVDGRIILVRDTDENFKAKKIKDILFIVNRDLGFSTTGLPTRSNVMILLFISHDKRVNGCLVAEEIQSASCVVSAEDSEKRMDGKTIWKLGSWYASSETVPALCGVNRIWVSHEFRRHKVASRMVDCLRQNFLYGYVVDMHELAFTDPTVDGRDFAASYTGTDNFLVYK